MIKSAQPQIVKDYLDRLHAALVGVPDGVGHEIMAGIAEELTGLDATEAATRIEELGDPAFIAAEARAGAGVGQQTSGTSMPEVPGDPRWYTVLASLLVALGGVVIPVLGWVMGIAMVWLSKTWRRWEKWVATLTPAVAALAAVSPSFIAAGAAGSGPRTGADVPNPLFPTWYDSLWSSLLLLVVLNVVVGIWLLWRGLRRPR